MLLLKINRKIYKGRSAYAIMENKIQTRKVQRILYFFSCPKCKKEITGTNESTAKRNLRYHLDAHKIKK